MRILGIETSCDETAVAVVEDGSRVLCNRVTSLQDAYAASGGVIPEDAARKQLEAILPVLHAALLEAKINPGDIDAIAVTRGPGLLGSLLVGTTAARLLASLWNKPLIGVHHTLGHLSSTWLEAEHPPQFPLLTLSVSGGHSDLWYRTAHTKGSLVGSTRDDAAGEAFDKGASMLELPYPGGPSMARAAQNGDPHAFPFPLPLHTEDTFDFSFSGLKTALKYTLRDLTNPLEKVLSDLAASYQHAICMHLVEQTRKALDQHPDVQGVHIVGGVSANTYLRTLFTSLVTVPLYCPSSIRYCTDNAAMIASAAFYMHQELQKNAYEEFATQATVPLVSILAR